MSTKLSTAYVSHTMVDYPGKMSAVFFLQGCNWDCTYCHNKELIPLESGCGYLTLEAFREFLESRRGLLDAIVISGGEPTIHDNLGALLSIIKEYGFLVGLHTNGSSTARLKSILPLCDWVGMDYKVPVRGYAEITQTADSCTDVVSSIKAILESGVDYEIRTTVPKTIISLLGVAMSELETYGVQHMAVQRVMLRDKGYVELPHWVEIMGNEMFEQFAIR